MVAQRCHFCVFCLVFLVFWGTRVSNVGHFRALETPGGDLGFQWSILGPSTGRKSIFGAPFWDGFGIPLGSVFEVLFGRPLDHVVGVVFVIFWTQKASLHKIMKNLIFAIIYCTSGMSQIPKTTLFLNIVQTFLLFFQGTVLGSALHRF